MGLDNDVRDIAQGAEAELRRVIAYLNDRVVPQVRTQSLQAYHAAAVELRKLADKLEQRDR